MQIFGVFFFLFSCHFPKQALQLNPGITPGSEKTDTYSHQSGKALFKKTHLIFGFLILGHKS